MLKNAILEMFPIGPEIPDHRRFDPVTAAIGGGTALLNIWGGSRQAKAAKQAAELQVKAATEAKDLLGTQLNEANRPIAEATQNAQQYATAGANRAIDTAGAGADRALNTAAQSNKLLDPYSTAGATAADYLNGAVAAGGDFNRKATMADYQFDPSVAFVQKQMEQSLARRGAGAGGYFSGEALKDLANQTYGLSSQEIAKAFDRGQSDTAARYSRLFGVAGMGMDASGQQANNLNTAARYAGDIGMQGAGMNLDAQKYIGSTGLQGAGMLSDNTLNVAGKQADIITGRGNAEGASKLAQGQAWNNAAVGAGNSAMDAYAIYKTGEKSKTKNPAVTK